MDRTFTYLLLLATVVNLAACGSRTTDREIKDTTVANNTVMDTQITTATSGEYNLEEDTTLVKAAIIKASPENLPIRAVGELVLKDSIDIAENEVISFMLLDSLLSQKKSSRDFYFKVFNKLMDRSGGSLGDAIGDYALTYVENYPSEFLANSKSFSKDRMASWASNIGIEIFLSANDSKDAFEKSTSAFQANCKGCSSSDLERLTSFNDMIKTTIEQNQKERTPY